MKDNFPESEVTNIRWANLEDAEKDVSVAFELKVPEYVQRTGRRMFLQPALFQRADAARFSSSTRHWPVYFQHPWKETDDIEIRLPEGYLLDHPDIPVPLTAGDTFQYVSSAQIRHGDSEFLLYHRELTFNGVLFPVTAYDGLKQLFDRVRENDQHAFSLIQGEKPDSKGNAK
jgi:hypothetical protein